MISNYQPFHKQALDLQYRFHDIVDNPSSPQAQVLQHEIHQLAEDIESEKHPRAIEDRVKTIQRQLIEVRAQQPQSQFMSPEDNHFMHHSYEQMREGIRRLPNY